MAIEGRDRDLVLAPGEFAYVLDTTKGLINVNVGPYKTSMAGTDQPVIWEKEKLRFARVDLDKAIQRDVVAPEGFYLALYNPAGDEKLAHPRFGASSPSADLSVGHRVHIPGPAHFPLWPGQMADVIRGHHLRSNQYLLAQVYNDTEATANWPKAVVKPQSATPPPEPGESTPLPTPTQFAPGQLMVIKGTDVAFFLPPTGIKVVPENDKFVREAVTLERLEYCILLDEDGNKRFVKGPDVVFPEPTETFVTKDNQRKFRAIELNETTGIYVKVIADYTDETGDHKAGDELFITGKEQAIYFQREEHSVIRYGDQTKHYAVAIPSGEGRYVLDRKTGVVDLRRGPVMLLCDPRHEVIVRRVLADKTVALWYPNNPKVLEVNRGLAASSTASAKATDASQYEAGRVMASSLGTSSNYMMLNVADEAALKSRQLAGDTFSRGTSFTPPRTLVLDTKYEGAVSITVWTGYAVLVIDKTGHRRVVVGPQNILLEYDETLAPLGLSTGRPKTTDKLLETVYLRVHNNAISDCIKAETSDLVPVDITVSYRVNFEGDDPEKWFAVENYIGLLCDHVRSLIRNAVKRTGIETFYGNAIDIVRDTVLGTADGGRRPGRAFDENAMRVYDVEVLDVAIGNSSIAHLLIDAQVTAMKSAMQIAEEERALAITIRAEDVKRAMAETKATTAEKIGLATQRELASTLDVALLRTQNERRVEQERLEAQVDAQTLYTTLNDAELARKKAQSDHDYAVREQSVDLELKRILGETEEIVKRTEAVDANLATAITTFADQALVERITTALAPMAAMSGVSVAEILAGLFKGTPFEGVMKQLGTHARMPVAQS
jgi:major vault protein